ncbi:MAG: hypothetical protein AB8H79_06065 [Myxococcota bacterium]
MHKLYVSNGGARDCDWEQQMRFWTLTLVGWLLSSHGLAEDQASDVQGQVCMAFGGNVKGYLPFK